MRRLAMLLAAALLACAAAGAVRAAKGVPTLIFPVIGTVQYTNDFGQPRGASKHQGNDLLGDKRAPVVAVEDGTVKYWTTSASAGCMLYLYGASGTMYEYIHLNNDLTTGNDNKGTCSQGVSYTVPDGAQVEAGQQIGYLGDSGDANGIHPHLHFEVHPGGKAAVSPFPYLKKASHLLVVAPAPGRTFTLKLTGTVLEIATGELTLSVQTLAAWPSHMKQSKLVRPLALSVPPTFDSSSLVPGEKVTVWTLPAPGTLPALTGAPSALTLDRLQTQP